MPLDPQALLAAQAAMHFVPPRESPSYGRAAVQLQDSEPDMYASGMGKSKSEEMSTNNSEPKIRPMRFRTFHLCYNKVSMPTRYGLDVQGTSLVSYGLSPMRSTTHTTR